MLSSTRILRAVAMIATLHATVVLPQERAAPRPALRLEPQEVTVEAGGTTEPVVVTLTSPPDRVLQADSVPLTVVLPRAIETLVGVEPEQPVLSFGRDGVATARFRLRTDAATPRARYRAEVVAGARRLVVAVMVLDVRNVRGLPPGPQKPDAQQVSDVPALAASAELAFASVLDPAGTVGLDGTKRTVYGGEVELPEDLVSIVPGAEGWDGRARFAWKSPYAEQYQWDWEVSLQPFPGPQAAAPASGIVASGAVPGQPVADQIGSFWIDFDDIPPLGQPFPTASESDGDTIAVVPGAASAAPATEGRHRAASAPRTGAAIPSPESRGEGGGALGQVLSVPTNIPVPEHAIDFHVRLVPRLPDGAPAGPPSNAVLLHYEPGADPATVQALEVAKEKAAVQHALDALESQAGQLYQLQILEFSPVVFADPNRWGCIEVIEKGVAVPTVAGYMAGETYCPGPWQGSGDSFGLDDLDPIDIAEGLADFVSGLYDDLKEGVLDLAMQGLPCPSSLEGACRAALSTALDAALASAGIPPSLPNFEEMKAAAEGELVDLAMETALNELPGGVACKGIPQCEQELRNAISTAIDQGVDAIIASSSEPHCGNVAQAHAHGREPLPCFNELPGWKVVPAAGAVYEPATVTVRVTRTAAPLPAGLEPSRCEVVVGMTLHNTFAGGRLGGNVDYQIVGPTELSGEPFHPAGLQIPPLAANQSATLTLALTRFTDFVIPGFSTLHHPYIRWEHWLPLYSGGKGVLSGRTSAHAAVKQGDATLAAKPVACGAAAQLPVP